MKTLDIHQSNLIQEYAYYVKLHAEAETYLLQSIRLADNKIQQENRNRAKWAAGAAMTAARCLGLKEEYIDSVLLSRASATVTS